MKAFYVGILASIVTCNVFATQIPQCKRIRKNSVKLSQPLLQLLTNMKELAAEGASLEAFEYEEVFVRMSSHCQTVNADDVVSHLRDTAVDTVGVADDAELALALKDFAAIVGNESYEKCSYTIPDYRTLAYITEFIGENYQIKFELGYED